MSVAVLRNLLKQGGKGKVNVPGVGMRARSTVQGYIRDPAKYKRIQDKSPIKTKSASKSSSKVRPSAKANSGTSNEALTKRLRAMFDRGKLTYDSVKVTGNGRNVIIKTNKKSASTMKFIFQMSGGKVKGETVKAGRSVAVPTVVRGVAIGNTRKREKDVVTLIVELAGAK